MTTPRKRRLPPLTPEDRAALADLDARIAAEDAEDFRREMRRIKLGLPEAPRTGIGTYPGWAEGGVTTSELIS